MRRSLFLGAVACGAFLLAATGAVAQEPSDAETYDAAYFARFNPTTAADMVRQVPGFVIDQGENVRGFAGAASNVLINGERPSTKESILDILQRIPARNVVRVDIVTSASGALDMRGQTKVANVVAELPDEGRSPVNWRVFARHIQGGRVTGEVQANTVVGFLGGSLALDFVGGQRRLEGPNQGARDIAGRAYFDAAGVQTEGHRGVVLNESVAVEPSAEFERRFGWGALRLNAGWNGCCGSGQSTYQVFTPDLAGAFDRTEASHYESDASTFTFGGDVERNLGGGGASTKLIFVNERSDSTNERQFEFFDGAGALFQTNLVDTEESSGESIVRGQINWSWGARHSIETSLEGAYNFLDSTRVISRNGVDITPRGSDTIVEELRGEARVSDIWSVSPSLTIEPAMAVEFSQIEQEVRDVAPPRLVERTFTYPKPSLAATWRPGEDRQFRFSLERRVAQLDFDDFVSSFEVVNETTSTGNTQLEPERTWALSGAYEVGFWDGGVLTFNASHDWVEGVQDRVCVAPPPESGSGDPPPCLLDDRATDGPGNLGDGRRWSVGVAASVPLERFGVSGGRLDVDANSASSTVVDPTTGESREFSDEFYENWSVDFRQDLTSIGASWGVSASGGSGTTAFRLRETFRRQRVGTNLNAFVETTRFFGTNIRLSYDNILENNFTSKRVVFDGTRLSGVPEEIRRTFSGNGQIISVRVAGAF